jgi:hypothetical protein
MPITRTQQPQDGIAKSSYSTRYVDAKDEDGIWMMMRAKKEKGEMSHGGGSVIVSSSSEWQSVLLVVPTSELVSRTDRRAVLTHTRRE